MKKALSLLLAFSMAATFSLGAFAESADLTISVSGPDIVEGDTIAQDTADAAATEDTTATGETAAVADVPVEYTVPDEDWMPTLSDEELAAIAEAVANSSVAEISEQTVDAAEVGEDTVDASLDSYSKDLAGFVDRMYGIALNRKPDTAGRNFWINRLKTHTDNGASLIFGILNSDEFKEKGYSNSKIVTIAYNSILGRDPDSAGHAHWLAGLDAGMSITGILNGFVSSPEFQQLCAGYGIISGGLTQAQVEPRDRNIGVTEFVSRLYTSCLGRTYDVAGLNNWCAVLLNNTATGATVAGQFVFSAEYKNKHVSNIDYVSMLYTTFLGRTPDSNGLVHWVELLNFSQSRAKVMNSFIASNEFREICAKAGVSISGKYDEPDDTETWKMNVKLLQLINSYRLTNGASYLKLRDDLYEVAAYRVKELPVRSAELVKAGQKVGSVDEYRPNNLGDYQTVYSMFGVNTSYKYELRASAPTTASPTTILEALIGNDTYKRMILNTYCTMFSGAFLYQDSRAWYSMEIAG